MIAYHCPGCRKRFDVSPTLVHLIDRCPDCDTPWRLGSPPPPQPPVQNPDATPNLKADWMQSTRLPPDQPLPGVEMTFSVGGMSYLFDQTTPPDQRQGIKSADNFVFDGPKASRTDQSRTWMELHDSQASKPLTKNHDPALGPTRKSATTAVDDQSRSPEPPTDAPRRSKLDREPDPALAPAPRGHGLRNLFLVLVILGIGGGVAWGLIAWDQWRNQPGETQGANAGNPTGGGDGQPPPTRETERTPEQWIEDLAEGGLRGERARRELLARRRLAVPALARATRDLRPTVRLAVVELLGELGPLAIEALPDLRLVLRDAQGELRGAAVTAVARVGKDSRREILATLLPLLEEGKDSANRPVLGALEPFVPIGRGDLPVIRDLLKSLAPQERVQFLAGLCLVQADAGVLVTLLTEMLNDPAAEVARLAANELGKRAELARGEAYPALLKLLLRADEALARPVLATLEKMGAADTTQVSALLRLIDEPGLPAITRLFAVKTIRPLARDQADTAKLPLLRALASSDPDLRQAAADALETLKPPLRGELPELLALLKNRQAHREQRLYAAWAIGEMGQLAASAAPDLIALFDDPNPALRRRVAIAFSKVNPRDRATVEALAKLISHNNVEVRKQAVSVLAPLIEVDGAFAALLQAFQDADPEVVKLAADGLDRLGKPRKEHLPLLGEALQSPKLYVRVFAASAIVKLGPEVAEALPQLIKAMEDSDLNVVLRVVKAIYNLGPKAEKAAPALEKALDHSDALVKLYAAAALTATEANLARAIPILLEGSKSEEKEQRQLAEQGLKRLNPRSRGAARPLLDKLTDEDVKKQALAALVRLEKAAVPELVRKARDPDPEVRFVALEILRLMGPAANTTDSLRVVLALAKNDPVLAIRQKAREAADAMQRKD